MEVSALDVSSSWFQKKESQVGELHQFFFKNNFNIWNILDNNNS